MRDLSTTDALDLSTALRNAEMTSRRTPAPLRWDRKSPLNRPARLNTRSRLDEFGQLPPGRAGQPVASTSNARTSSCGLCAVTFESIRCYAVTSLGEKVVVAQRRNIQRSIEAALPALKDVIRDDLSFPCPG